jgi:hypothetical protein
VPGGKPHYTTLPPYSADLWRLLRHVELTSSLPFISQYPVIKRKIVVLSELHTFGRLIALSLRRILVIPLKKRAFVFCMGDLRNDNFVVQARNAKKSWQPRFKRP